MKRHDFHPAAEIELLTAADFYESRENGLGRRFVMAVRGAIERLTFDPEARPKIVSDVRRQPVEDFQYDVLYVDEADRIWIIAVAHYSRKTAYWRKRVSER